MMDDKRIEMPTALGIGGPVTQVTKARGGRVYELGHVEGKPQVPSVTSIIDGAVRNFGLEVWRKQHIERGLQNHSGEVLTTDAINRIMSASSDEAETSAALGSTLHNIIEALLRGEEVIVPDQLEPAVEGFRKWREAFSHWDLAGTEVTVYDLRSHKHTQLGYAGTVDALWKSPGKNGTHDYIVVDWKTSSGIYPSALMQVAAYANALSRMLGNDTHVSGMVVRFVNDYPRVAGKKDRSQPKIFSSGVEYAWANHIDGFNACLHIHQANKARVYPETIA